MTPGRGATGRATATISGSVRDTGGQPCPEARVMIAGDSPDHQDIAQLTDRRGGFRFAGLAPGRYTIAAFADGSAAGRATVSVSEGEAASLDVDLEDGG